MATRGMLPKFRPAILGGQKAAPRPVIRAVKPTAPLPPPAPPRRMPSGIQYPPVSEEDPSTASGPAPMTIRMEEPTTARQPSVPDDSADTFDDETRVRGEQQEETRSAADAETRLRTEARADFECETKRHPPSQPDAFPSTRRGTDEPLDTVRALYDEDSFEEATSALPQNDSFEEETSALPSTVQEPTLDRAPFRSDDFSRERVTDPPGTHLSAQPFDRERDEDSGARARPEREVPRSMAQLRTYDDDASTATAQEPIAARIDALAFDGVVKRTLPLERQDPFPATTAPEVPVHMQPVHAAPAAALGYMATQLDASPQMAPAQMAPMHMQPAHMQPAHMQPVHMPVHVPSAPLTPSRMPPAQMQAQMPAQMAAFAALPYPNVAPIPQRILPNAERSFSGPNGAPMHMTPAPRTARGDGRTRSKVGRFAWFVFGAAFGLFFAFFATGFVSSRLAKKDDAVPPPPVMTPPAMTAAVATGAPTAVAVVPVAAMPAAPTQAVIAQVASQAAPTPVAPVATTSQAPTPVATVVARPRTERHVHRSTPPPAPKAAAAPAPVDDDDDGLGPPPRAATAKKPADVGDLLNAGLAP